MWYAGAATPLPARRAGEESGVGACRWRGGGLGSAGISLVVGKGMLDGGGWGCLSLGGGVGDGGGRCLSGRGRGCGGRRWSGRECVRVVGEERGGGVLVGDVEDGVCG